MQSKQQFDGQFGSYLNNNGELSSLDNYFACQIQSTDGTNYLLKEYDCLPADLVINNLDNCIKNKNNFPNVCCIHDYFKNEGKFYIVQDFYKLTLENFLDNNKQKIITELIEGVEQLHKNKIVHREIKPSKIAYVGTTYKFTDFGKYHEIVNLRQANRISQQNFDAPETLGAEDYQIKSDIWSLAHVIYWIYTGKQFLFSGEQAHQIQTSIKNHVKDQSIAYSKIDLLEIPRQGKNILKRMLNPDPRQRPDIYEISRQFIVKLTMSVQIQPKPENTQKNVLSMPSNQQQTLQQIFSFCLYPQNPSQVIGNLERTAQFNEGNEQPICQRNFDESFIVLQKMR